MASTCKKCENPTSCDVNSVPYITHNVLAAIVGLGLTTGGFTLNISSNGLMAHVGNAMMGAGMCTLCQGIEKTIQKKRYNSIVFCADAACGAATNTLTGGIYIAGDRLIITIAQRSAIKIAIFSKRIFTIQMITGVVGGITTKITSEIKECITKEKNWSCFGKTIGQSGEEKGTVTSWIVNTIIGGLYRVSAIYLPRVLKDWRPEMPKFNMCRYRWNTP